MKLKRNKGFTIIELVIVIAVIGILSAVLIPTFSGLVGKANETALQEGLRNAYTEYASDYTYSSSTPTLYTREKIVFSTSEIAEESGEYLIPISSENTPIYCSNENGRFIECTQEQSCSQYLGEYGGYHLYACQ